MKLKYCLFAVGLFALLFATSCRKKKLTVTEESLTFVIVPDPNPGVATALSEAYPFKVNITSAMPSGGVTIDVITVNDLTNAGVDSKSLSSSISSVDITTGAILPGVLYKTTVTVSSKVTPTNSSTKSFKVARK